MNKGLKLILFSTLISLYIAPASGEACDERSMVMDLRWCMNNRNMASYARSGQESIQFSEKLLGTARGGSVNDGRQVFRICHANNSAALERINRCDDTSLRRAAHNAYNNRR